jgi:hypothetical protein
MAQKSCSRLVDIPGDQVCGPVTFRIFTAFSYPKILAARVGRIWVHFLRMGLGLIDSQPALQDLI